MNLIDNNWNEKLIEQNEDKVINGDLDVFPLIEAALAKIDVDCEQKTLLKNQINEVYFQKVARDPADPSDPGSQLPDLTEETQSSIEEALSDLTEDIWSLRYNQGNILLQCSIAREKSDYITNYLSNFEGESRNIFHNKMSEKKQDLDNVKEALKKMARESLNSTAKSNQTMLILSERVNTIRAAQESIQKTVRSNTDIARRALEKSQDNEARLLAMEGGEIRLPITSESLNMTNTRRFAEGNFDEPPSDAQSSQSSASDKPSEAFSRILESSLKAVSLRDGSIRSYVTAARKETKKQNKEKKKNHLQDRAELSEEWNMWKTDVDNHTDYHDAVAIETRNYIDSHPDLTAEQIEVQELLRDSSRKVQIGDFNDQDWIGFEIYKEVFPDKDWVNRPSVILDMAAWFFEAKLGMPKTIFQGMDIIKIEPLHKLTAEGNINHFPKTLVITFSSTMWPPRIFKDYIRNIPRPPKIGDQKLTREEYEAFYSDNGQWEVDRAFPKKMSKRLGGFKTFANNMRKTQNVRTTITIREDYTDFELKIKRGPAPYEIYQSANAKIRAPLLNPTTPTPSEAGESEAAEAVEGAAGGAAAAGPPQGTTMGPPQAPEERRKRKERSPVKKWNPRDLANTEDEEEDDTRSNKSSRHNSPDRSTIDLSSGPGAPSHTITVSSTGQASPSNQNIQSQQPQNQDIEKQQQQQQQQVEKLKAIRLGAKPKALPVGKTTTRMKKPEPLSNLQARPTQSEKAINPDSPFIVDFDPKTKQPIQRQAAPQKQDDQDDQNDMETETPTPKGRDFIFNRDIRYPNAVLPNIPIVEKKGISPEINLSNQFDLLRDLSDIEDDEMDISFHSCDLNIPRDDSLSLSDISSAPTSHQTQASQNINRSLSYANLLQANEERCPSALASSSPSTSRPGAAQELFDSDNHHSSDIRRDNDSKQTETVVSNSKSDSNQHLFVSAPVSNQSCDVINQYVNHPDPKSLSNNVNIFPGIRIFHKSINKKFFLKIASLNSNTRFVRNIAHNLIRNMPLCKDIEIAGVFIQKKKVQTNSMKASIGLKIYSEKSQYQIIQVSYISGILVFETTINNRVAGIRTSLFLLRIIINMLEQCASEKGFTVVKDLSENNECCNLVNLQTAKCMVCSKSRHVVCLSSQRDIAEVEFFTCKDVCPNFNVSFYSDAADSTIDLLHQTFDSRLKTLFTKGLYSDEIFNLKNFNISCPPAQADGEPVTLHTVDPRDPLIRTNSRDIQNILNDSYSSTIVEHQKMMEVFSSLKADKDVFCYKHTNTVQTRKRTRSISDQTGKYKRKCRFISASNLDYDDILVTELSDNDPALSPLSASAVRPAVDDADISHPTFTQSSQPQQTAAPLPPLAPSITETIRMMASRGNKNKDNSIRENNFIKALGTNNLKSISIKNFTKTQHELKDEWLWLNKKKQKQPPIRDKTGKIKVIAHIKDLDPQDVWQMSQAQLLASWKLSTGILENKLELMQERLKVNDSLVAKYQRDLNAIKSNRTNTPKIISDTNNTQEDLTLKIFDINHKLTSLTNKVTDLIESGKDYTNCKEYPNS